MTSSIGLLVLQILFAACSDLCWDVASILHLKARVALQACTQDDLSALLERLGQPLQDLVAAYRFTGPHQELLDHCLRILVGNDLVHPKYDDDSLVSGMRCILEGVYARKLSWRLATLFLA